MRFKRTMFFAGIILAIALFATMSLQGFICVPLIVLMGIYVWGKQANWIRIVILIFAFLLIAMNLLGNSYIDVVFWILVFGAYVK